MARILDANGEPRTAWYACPVSTRDESPFLTVDTSALPALGVGETLEQRVTMDFGGHEPPITVTGRIGVTEAA